MPKYSFKCKKCNYVESFYQSFKDCVSLGDISDKPCSKCNALKLTRILLRAPAKMIGKSITRQKSSFDGFGYHDSLNMNFKGPKHYRSYLKEKGLIEHNSEKAPVIKEKELHYKDMIDDSFLKDCVERGAEISGNEASALKEGKIDTRAAQED